MHSCCARVLRTVLCCCCAEGGRIASAPWLSQTVRTNQLQGRCGKQCGEQSTRANPALPSISTVKRLVIQHKHIHKHTYTNTNTCTHTNTHTYIHGSEARYKSRALLLGSKLVNHPGDHVVDAQECCRTASLREAAMSEAGEREGGFDRCGCVCKYYLCLRGAGCIRRQQRVSTKSSLAHLTQPCERVSKMRLASIRLMPLPPWSCKSQ